MIPAGLYPPSQAPCSGAPVLSAAAASDTLDTCAGGNGWQTDIAVTYSGSFGAAFELELWVKAWEDAASEPGSYTYNQRKTGVGASVVTFTDIEVDTLLGSVDQGSGSVTKRRKWQARVVPAASSNGAGPFCDSVNDSQLDRFAYNCAI